MNSRTAFPPFRSLRHRPLPSCRVRRARRGFTLIEGLAAMLVVGILMAGSFNLLLASWRAYDNLVWQNKVNMEARQALDDICDDLRMAGANRDMINPVSFPGNSYYQVATNKNKPFDSSGRDKLQYQLPYDYSSGSPVYIVLASPGGARYLRGGVGLNRYVAQHIKEVLFEYEYRPPSTSTDDVVGTWTSVRESPVRNSATSLPMDISKLTHTVYVTVVAEASPHGANGPSYTRRLTSAVHLRAPYNNAVPPSQYGL